MIQRKDRLLFDGEKEMLEEYGCVVEITKESKKYGIYICNIDCPEWLFDETNNKGLLNAHGEVIESSKV